MCIAWTAKRPSAASNMTMQEYQTSKDVLHSRIVRLEQLTQVVESYKHLLEEKTKGYVTATTTQRPPYPHSWFYIVRWFRTFVGIKDEAMLLINGELVRKYHKQQHEAHIHTRGKEDKYYKVPGLLGLSGCSCDGLNYDLRLISKKYKEYATKRKEEEILNRLSDRVYEAEDRLDGFCKTIDKMVDVFRTELKKKASSHIKSIVIEFKYKAEHLTVKFEPTATTCTDAAYSCQEARKGSRMHALHSGIEEPPTISAVQPPIGATSDTAIHSDPTISRPQKARRLLVEDDEDIAYQQEVTRKRAEAAAEAARLAALEAQKAPDFGFHYSIDAEKREFNAAVELLALPTERDLHREDDDDPMDVTADGSTTNGTGMDASSGPEWLLQPRPLSTEELTLREQSTLKLKVHFPGYATTGPTTSSARSRVEGTEIVTFSAAAGSTVVSLLSHAHLSVSLAHCKTITDLGRPVSSRGAPVPTPVVVKVAVDEVVQEVWRQLWLGGILGKTDLLVLPEGVRIGSEEYRTGARMPIPTAEDLQRKRYQVLCEGREPARRWLQLVASTMLERTALSSNSEDEVGFREFITAHRHLLVRLSDYICAYAERAEDGSPWLDLRDTSPVSVSDDDADHMETLLGLGRTCIGTDRHLSIDISGNQQWKEAFPALLRSSTQLRAQASGVTYLDLLNCIVAAQPDDSPTHSTATPASALLRLQRLDLSFNHSLTYVDAPWELLALPPGLLSSLSSAQHQLQDATNNAPVESTESHSEPMDLDVVDLTSPQPPQKGSTDGDGDPAQAFLTWLLCCTPELLVVDLSHCATTAAQAETLYKALKSALAARAQRGSPPVKDIVVHGLQQLHPAGVEELLRSVSFHSRIDVSGGSFVI